MRFTPTLLLVTFLFPAPAASAADEVEDASKETRVDLTQATEKVDLQRELKTYREIFRRRLALHYLRNEASARSQILSELDPVSKSTIKSLVENNRRFKNLDYHFLERRRNAEDRILAKLRLDGFQGIEDVLEAVRDLKFPESAAFADLLNLVELNFRWALRKGIIQDEDFAKDVGQRLTAETVRVNGTAGHDTAELAKAMWKDTKRDEFPAWWFDPASGPISYAFGPVPDAPRYPVVDLNTAGVDDLLEIPNLEREVAEAIVDYARRRGFEGPEELRLVKQVPRHLVRPLQTVCTASHRTKHKKWTVMVFLNAANNLEPFGIEDMNEMEKVGSTRDVNIVVELARYREQPKGPQPNTSYLWNPYSERPRQYYFGLENEPRTARFYVLKDDDDVRVRSVLKDLSGLTDAGDPKTLAAFGRWAVEHYPADHYALVVWNHGAGWSGVSFDDNTRRGLDLPEVRTALEEVTALLREKQGKERIDVLDFDACLMATAEVGYELKDVVDFLVASQEVEPGDGMPYDDYLEWLVTYPEAPPVAFAKAMVDRYVKSYAPKGSQTGGDFGWFHETKSALRLARMEDLRRGVEKVAALLLERKSLLGETAEEIVSDARRFGRLVDIQDFFTRLVEKAPEDEQLKAAIKEVTDLIGYPTENYPLVNEVVIKRRRPGNVIWGFNGWKAPPRHLAPFVWRSRLAKTPLVGPDEKGNYVARIQFPPTLRDPSSGKEVFVERIDYRFEDEKKERKIEDFENMFVTTDFPPDGPVVAEGHLVSNNRSHGVSIYFPAYLGFDKEYLKLRFAQDSKWVEMCRLFPLRKIEDPQPIAVLGVRHLNRPQRERLGRIVVREQFRDAMRRLDYASVWRKDLAALGHGFDVVEDPRPYGLDWEEMLRYWQDGVVLLDNHDGVAPGGGRPLAYLSSSSSPPPASGPSGRELKRFLERGGRMLLCSPRATAKIWDQPLYRDLLGLEYGGRVDDDYGARLLGGDPLPFEIVPARKGSPILTFRGGEGVEPLCVRRTDGRVIGARIRRPGPDGEVRAVVLGFYLTDVLDEVARRAILEQALRFLTETPEPPPPPVTTAGEGAPTQTAPAAEGTRGGR